MSPFLFSSFLEVYVKKMTIVIHCERKSKWLNHNHAKKKKKPRKKQNKIKQHRTSLKNYLAAPRIQPPSKCCHILQPAHPNKHHPQNLATWHGVDNNMRMCMHIICAYKQAYYRSCVHACVSISVDATLEI